MSRSSSSFARIFLLIFLAGVALFSQLYAQTGDILLPEDRLSHYRKWSALPQPHHEQRKVDLRPYLPRPGRQYVNDCLAWATNYGAKTYYEALDQGWTPDHPSRIFSPSFMYNHLNGGQDNGLNIIKASEFLETQGAITLDRQPYLGKNYTAPISPALNSEASLFKTQAAFLVDNWMQIRTALSQGDVVILGVNTNPVFNSGRYPIYTLDLHKKGYAMRKPDQPHARHAMLIVGYDDDREAFLVMNSWGEDWGLGGFVWVHYDVCKTYNTQSEEQHLINWTATIVDIKEKVTRTPDGRFQRSEEGDISSLKVETRGAYRGWNDAMQEYQYLYQVELSGHNQALNNVQKVDWKIHDGSNENITVLTSELRSINFRTLGYAKISNFTVEGTITFTDGQTRDISGFVKLPSPAVEDRKMELTSKVKYWGKSNNGTPLFSITMVPEMSLYDLADIRKIEWDLNGMTQFSETKSSRYTWESDSGSSFGREPSFETAKATEASAKITFRDGSTRTLKHTPDLSQAPIIDEPRLTNIWREVHAQNAEDRYTFSVWMQYPESMHYLIDKVVYDMGPIYDNRKFQGYANRNFIIDGYATKEFDIVATIYFTDGTTKTITHWVELGPEGKYIDKNLIDVGWSDKYYGIDSFGRRTWDVLLRPRGHRDSLRDLEKVVYHLPKERFSQTDIPVTRQDINDLSYNLLLTEDLEMEATLYLTGGRQTTVKIEPQPDSPIKDSIGISVQTVRRGHIDIDRMQNNRFAKDGQLLYWEAELVGPQNFRNQVRSIEHHYYRGDRMRRTVENNHHLYQPQLFRFEEILEQPFELVSRITYYDGYEEEVITPVGEFGGESDQTPMKIRHREKFWGWENDEAMYLNFFTIDGVGEEYNKIEKVVYKLSEEGVAEVTRPPFLFGQLLYATYDLKIYIYRQGVEEPEVIPYSTKGRAARPKQPLNIHWILANYGQEERRWIAYLDGWEKYMRGITEVRWSCQGNELGVITQRKPNKTLDGFPVEAYSVLPQQVVANVTFNDGTTMEVSGSVGYPGNDWVSYEVKNLYWGDNVWEFEFNLVGDPLGELRDVRDIDYFSRTLSQDKGFRRSNTGPRFTGWWRIADTAVIEPSIGRISGGFRKLDPYSPSPSAWHYQAPELDMRFISVPEEGKALALDNPHYRAAQKRNFPDKDFRVGRNERIYYVVGPEKDMSRIGKVRYHVIDNDQRWEIPVTRRYGTFTHGFELRLFENTMLEKATIEYIDFATGNATGTRELLPTFEQ